MHGMYAGKERRNRMVALVLTVVLLAGVVLALLATVFQASSAQALPLHASLVSISPADGAELAAGPTEIRLTFDNPVTPGLAKIRLTRDETPVETGPPTVTGTVVTAAVTDKAGGGAYRIAWQVASDDGHPISGESSFTVTAAAAGAAPPATPRVTPTYKTPQTQPTTFGHPDHVPGLVVAAVLLLGGVALLVYEHRRRRHLTDSGTAPGNDPQDRQRIS
jgi:methionine-rich copper-binding protein CopC